MIPPDYIKCQRIGLLKFIQELHIILGKLFYKLGFRIGQKPFFFIVVPIIITLFGITGVQQINYQANPEVLFTPVNGKGWQERRLVESLFPVNSSSAFDLFRLTKQVPFCNLIISAKDNGDIFKINIFKELLALDNTVQTLTIDYDERTYSYQDVCAKIYGNCLENKILDLNEHMSEIENGTLLINYPIMLYPVVLPYYLRGVTVNESEGIIKEVKGTTLSYFFKFDSKLQVERSLMFERKLMTLLDDIQFEYINVHRMVSRSLTDELDRNIQAVAPFLGVLLLLMLGFILSSLFISDWVRSKLSIGILGMTSAILSTACSFGFLMYFQVPFIGINLAVPFLMLGIGLDDMFVVLSAWNKTNIEKSVPIRLAEAYSDAAVSITITSLTSTLSFCIGIFTPFPAASIFCIYISVSCTVTYIWFITFFGGCLALSGSLERKGKHNVTCRSIMPKSKAVDLGCCYKFWCTGGYNPEDPKNPKDNEEHVMRVFFRDYLGSALNKASVKVLVFFAFALYLAGAIYGCTQVQEALQVSKMALDDSYLVDYHKARETLPSDYPFTVQVIIKESLNYSDHNTRNAVLELHKEFERSKFIGAQMFSQSWMRRFYKFLDRRNDNITTEKQFIEILKNEYLTPGRRSPEFLDVKFNEDETQIVASRFIISVCKVRTMRQEKEAMLELRKIAQDSSLGVEVYFMHFIYYDQLSMVTHTCIQTIIIASIVMMFVSFIFIPNYLCAFCVAFSIFSIETGVIGYMTLWNINMDIISTINLIMCVGFSVDFSAHITYSFITSEAKTSAGKVKECLFNMGLPILQGGLSTIMGVLVLVAIPSYIFNAFFKINFLSITFGLMHGLLFLPVMLSIIGPGSNKTDVDHKSDLPSDHPSQCAVTEESLNVPPPIMKSNYIMDKNNAGDDFGLGSSLSSSIGSRQDIDNISENSSNGSFTTAKKQLTNSSLEDDDGGHINESFCEDVEKGI